MVLVLLLQLRVFVAVALRNFSMCGFRHHEALTDWMELLINARGVNEGVSLSMNLKLVEILRKIEPKKARPGGLYRRECLPSCSRMAARRLRRERGEAGWGEISSAGVVERGVAAKVTTRRASPRLK